MSMICASRGGPNGISQINPRPPSCVVARCLMRSWIWSTVAWAGCPVPRMVLGRCLASIGGLVMIMSTPAGKACAKRAGVMVMVSIGNLVSHPLVASGGRRRGCRACSLARRWVVAAWASGSTSAHVYEATTWPAFRSAFSPVAMPPQSSTRWIGLSGMWYLGRVARGGGL